MQITSAFAFLPCFHTHLNHCAVVEGSAWVMFGGTNNLGETRLTVLLGLSNLAAQTLMTCSVFSLGSGANVSRGLLALLLSGTANVKWAGQHYVALQYV